MKNVLVALAAAAIASSLGTSALADTVNFVYTGLKKSTITFVNNDSGEKLTCTFRGSGAGAVNGGCNWDVSFQSNNMRQKATQLRHGNDVCDVVCEAN